MNEKNKRIKDEVIKDDYSVEGEILTAEDLNKLSSVFKAGINGNKFDLDRLLTGSNNSIVASDRAELYSFLEEEPLDERIKSGVFGFTYDEEPSGEGNTGFGIYRVIGTEGNFSWEFLDNWSIAKFVELGKTFGSVETVNGMTGYVELFGETIKIGFEENGFTIKEYVDNIVSQYFKEEDLETYEGFQKFLTKGDIVYKTFDILPENWVLIEDFEKGDYYKANLTDDIFDLGAVILYEGETIQDSFLINTEQILLGERGVGFQEMIKRGEPSTNVKIKFSSIKFDGTGG